MSRLRVVLAALAGAAFLATPVASVSAGVNYKPKAQKSQNFKPKQWGASKQLGGGKQWGWGFGSRAFDEGQDFFGYWDQRRAADRRKRFFLFNFAGVDPEPAKPKSPDAGFEVYKPVRLVALSSPDLAAPTPSGEPAAAILEELRAPATPLKVTGGQRDAIVSFYRLNGFAPLWVGAQGLNDKAKRVLALLAEAEEEGLNAADYLLPNADATESPARLEIAVTAMALRYAQHLHSGRIVPKRLSGYYDLEPPALDLGQVLFQLSVRAEPDRYLASLAPTHPSYAAMKASLAALRREKGSIEAAAAEVSPSKPQRDTAGTLVLNMERMRWLPRELGERHVFVNQAAFELRLVEHGDIAWRTKVIVGTPNTQTAVFSDALESVVINPYWGVPQSIIRHEMMPRMAKNRRWLERNGYEAVNERGRVVPSSSVNWWAYRGDIPFGVRQPPGDGNALGRVKFLFPNSHDIYMHDTPTKELFAEEVRAFSHGCVRVESPRVFASHVLGWERERVDAEIAAGETRKVPLQANIPVHLNYFTAWPDAAGKIVFHPDIYKRDVRLDKALQAVIAAGS